MSKTTPEEARQLATKHLGEFWSGRQMVQLAALIDEARGMDAEPVAWVLFRRDEDGLEPIQLYGGSEKPSGEFKDRFVLRAVYFHPAPSQPAEPEWIDDPHDIEQGLIRNPKWRNTEPVASVHQTKQGAEIRFLNLEADIRRVLGWERPICDFEIVKELQEALERGSVQSQPAAPVELPVVAVNKEWADKDMSILIHCLRTTTNFDAVLIGEMLEYAKQAAIAARRKV